MAKKSNPFDASMFTATKHSTAEDKAEFGNHLLAFIDADFPKSKFTKAFYERLMRTFGHIAHYDREGFWSTFFTNTADKIEFLKQTIEYPTFCTPSPQFTFSDVERAVRVALLAKSTLARYEAQNRAEIELEERNFLARLKSKYEPDNGPAVTGERILSLAEFMQVTKVTGLPLEPATQGLLF
jgi:hypothetical protein